MSKEIQMVAEFHSTFRHPVLSTPQIPIERVNLRISLLQEELNELKQAISDGDIIEVADAFCDLQYVLAGAILEFGLAKSFDLLFSEVHRSNMSKACISESEANETIEAYRQLDGTESYFEQVGDLFLIYRKSDNKTLKSVNYSPANIKMFLNGGNNGG